jgi:hypothetical protein
MQRAKSVAIHGAENNVAFQLFEDRFRHPRVTVLAPWKVAQGRAPRSALHSDEHVSHVSSARRGM